MSAPYSRLCLGLWLAWFGYLLLTALDVKEARRSESLLSRLLHMGPLAAAFFLLFDPRLGAGPLGWRLLPAHPIFGLTGLLLTASGLAFATWARVHLARNWSAVVTLKEGHELVRTGPYALARHPLYTGFLLAVAGTAVAAGEGRGLLASALVAAALVRKLRLEERFLLEHFGESYRAYRRDVKALIPWLF